MNHIPVLVREVIDWLSPKPGDVLLDATLGHGGHAKAFLENVSDSRVIGIDADRKALSQARKELGKYKDRVQLIHGTFAHVAELVGEQAITHALFDLGIGSHQLADLARGFSFRHDAPLTMRYGATESAQMALPPSDHQAVRWLEKRLGYAPDAGDIISGLREEELADVIRQYGDERFSRRIARAIKRAGIVETSRHLADVIAGAVPVSYERGRIHPATRTFQALRIVVNRELESLTMTLPQVTAMLSGGGRLAVISFHSLEDRIVKQFMRSSASLDVLTKKPVSASKEETQANPRARSAKLRVAQKITTQKQTHDSKHLTTHHSSPPPT